MKLNYLIALATALLFAMVINFPVQAENKPINITLICESNITAYIDYDHENRQGFIDISTPDEKRKIRLYKTGSTDKYSFMTFYDGSALAKVIFMNSSKLNHFELQIGPKGELTTCKGARE